ncbi:MAG TPA: SGNH/GDSL hydrolase family protein, partial [bacterium]|nr:SGNH/GDSL hydrolase family protein [bacterium]
MLALLGSTLAVAFAGSTGWVGTWSTAPQLVETNNNPPAPGLTSNTLRQILRVSIGGDTLRMRFSNEFSSAPVTLQRVLIAASAGGGVIDPATERPLLFQGGNTVTIPPGLAATSDPFPFSLQPRMELAVTIHFGSTPSGLTGHPGSRTTSYLLAGDQTGRADFAGAVRTDHWYIIHT